MAEEGEDPQHAAAAAATAEDAPLSESSDATKESSPPPPTSAFSQLSLSIWPPTQRTRDAVSQRLVETLSSASSVLTKRYGVVPADEASAAAARIEDEAFSAASAAAGSDSSSIDDGIETLQLYSREISRRMLEFVKSRYAPTETSPTSAAAAGDSTAESKNEEEAPTPAADTAAEEASSHESEA